MEGRTQEERPLEENPLEEEGMSLRTRRLVRPTGVVLGLVMAFILLTTTVNAQTTIHALLIGGLDHQEVFERLIPEFEKRTGIRVEWTTLPREQLVLRVTTLGQARSDQYDVYSTHFSTVPQFYHYLEPLQDYFADELDDFLPASYEYGILEGNLYHIPRYFDSRMLFYRTDVLAEAGLEPPRTWDELLEAAQKLTDPARGMWGFISVGKGNALMRHFSDFLWQAGGDFLNENYNPIFNGPEGEEALQFLVDLVHKYRVSPPGSVGYGWTEGRTLFAQGGGALYYDWPSALPHYEDPERSAIVGKYGFAPIPGKLNNISTAVTHGFGINRYSRQKEAAAEFIRWITSTEFQVMEYETRGTLPARASAIERVINAATGLEKERLEALRAIALEGRSWPAIPEMAEIERIIFEELERALTRTKTPKQALDDAAAAVRTVLEEAGYYR